MKKHIVVKIILCTFFVLGYAEYGEAGSNPKEVLVKYLGAAFTNDNKTLYECISKEAKEGQTLNEFLAKEPKGQNELEKAFAGKVSYEIKGISVVKDAAKAEVSITVPDFKKMFSETASEMWKEALKSTIEGKKEQRETKDVMAGQAIIKNAIKKFKGKDVPLITANETIEMVKENGVWKVRYKRQKL